MGRPLRSLNAILASFSQLENVNRSQLIQDFSNALDQLTQQRLRVN